MNRNLPSANGYVKSNIAAGKPAGGVSACRGIPTPGTTENAATTPPNARTAMVVQTANALITGAPISDEQIAAAREHFAGLEAVLSVSGPRFANARAEAANLHNVAVKRAREMAHERRQRALLQADRDAGLVEIEV